MISLPIRIYLIKAKWVTKKKSIPIEILQKGPFKVCPALEEQSIFLAPSALTSKELIQDWKGAEGKLEHA